MSEQSFGAMLVFENVSGRLEELYGTVDLSIKVGEPRLKTHVFAYWGAESLSLSPNDFIDCDSTSTDYGFSGTFYSRSYLSPRGNSESVVGLLSCTLADGTIIDVDVTAKYYIDGVDDLFESFEYPGYLKCFSVTPL